MLIADIVALVILALGCAAGVLLTLLQLPGTWVLVAATAGYAWFDGGQRVSLGTVLVLAGLAAAGEVLELATGAWAARWGGASRRAMFWGLVGGMAGALLLSVPVPVIGTILGAAGGCFAGTLAAEMYGRKPLAGGTRAAGYAALGRSVGAFLKLGLVLVMVAVVAGAAWRGSQPGPQSGPASQPAPEIPAR